MKIHKAIKMALTGAAFAVPAGVVLAAPATPPQFGQWSINASGQITATNPAGMTCAASTNTDVGFMQRVCTDGSGKQYIQTINAEGGTGDTFGTHSGTGFFGDESFVVMGSTVGGGLAGKQQLFEGNTPGADTFQSDAQLNTGGEFAPTITLTDLKNSLTGAPVKINLDQSISNTAQEFTADFKLREGDDASGVTSNIIDLRGTANDTAAGFDSSFALQDLTVETTGAAATNSYHKFSAQANLNTTDISQSFDLEERSGAAVGAGSITMPNGTTTSWSAGDFMARLAIGQDITGAGVFGLTDIANETTSGAADTDSFSTNNVPFGTISGSDPWTTF